MGNFGGLAGTLQRSRWVSEVFLDVTWRPHVAPRAHLGIQGAAWESIGAAEGTFGALQEVPGDPQVARALIDTEVSETKMGRVGHPTSI